MKYNDLGLLDRIKFHTPNSQNCINPKENQQKHHLNAVQIVETNKKIKKIKTIKKQSSRISPVELLAPIATVVIPSAGYYWLLLAALGLWLLLAGPQGQILGDRFFIFLIF